MITLTPPSTNKFDFFPSSNPILYTLSTTTISPNLAYIITIFVNNTLVAKTRYVVYNTAQMTIDIRNIVNAYIKEMYVNNATSPITQSSEYAQFYIQVVEEVDGVIDAGTSVQSNVSNIWLSAAQPFEWRDLSKYQYQFQTQSTQYDLFGRFLAYKANVGDVVKSTYGISPNPLKISDSFDLSNIYEIGETEQRTASFFKYDNTQPTPLSDYTEYLNVFLYDKNKIFLGQFGKKISGYSDKILAIPVGVNELNSITWDYKSPASLIIDSNTEYYFVAVNKDYGISYHPYPYIGNNSPKGLKWLGFHINRNNCYKVYRILYKSSEGGWNQIRCEMKHSQQLSRKAKTRLNTWGQAAGLPLADNTRFTDVTKLDITNKITLNTDYITNQNFVDEIEDMICSPIHYILDELNNVIPAVLSDSNFKIATINQDKMVQYEFEFDLDNITTLQY